MDRAEQKDVIGLAILSLVIGLLVGLTIGKAIFYEDGVQDQKNGKIVWSTNTVQNVTFLKVEKE